MKSVDVTFYTKQSALFWWGYLSNLEEYEKYIPFIRDVNVYGPLKKGSYWCDITTIAFFPFRIRHNIVEWQEKKKIVFEVPQPIKGGMVRETIFIKSLKEGAEITGIIDINYPKGIINRALEWILSKRFDYMLREAFKKIEKEGLRLPKK